MNELAELQQLLQQLLQGIQNALAGGEQLSDEFQMQLAQTLQTLLNRIEQLQSPAEELPPTQETDKLRLSRPFPSSNVHSFGYDDKNGRLYVRFQGDYPSQDGPVYAYEGVPQNIFEIFRRGAIPARTSGRNAWGEWWKGKVPSLGASLYSLIKQGNYPYQRLS